MRKLSTFFFLLLFALTIVGCGGSSSSTPVVEPTVVAATDDAYQTLSDTAFTIDAPGVLSNDTGTGLTVSAYDTASAEGGTVAMATDGGFTYTPPVSYIGTDSFTYTATDGATQDTGTVLVTVEPITTFSELQKRLASNAGAGDIFGWSVSISGDYAIVGAPHEDTGGLDIGAAYIFHRDQGGADNWGEVTKLIASDFDDSDYFGASVSISGDYAIVGAYGEDTGGSYAGAAYIFHRDEGGVDNWGEVNKLTASDAQSNDWFGHSVSISGDYAIIGAPYDDTLADHGAAYIFHRDEGGVDNWGEVNKLTASNHGAEDQFGCSVSINGDHAIVGAYREDTGGGNAGAAYLFHRDQGGTDNWGEVTILTASDADASDYFGYSVSMGTDYFIVGASRKDIGGNTVGAAYIFYRNQGGADNWGEVTILTAAAAVEFDNFGRSVSISDDYAIVGAFGEDTGGTDAGAAFLFHRNEGGADSWGEVDKLTASDAQTYDYFGWSVSIDGDSAIVGARDEDFGGTNAGAAYIFEKDLAP